MDIATDVFALQFTYSAGDGIASGIWSARDDCYPINFLVGLYYGGAILCTQRKNDTIQKQHNTMH